MNYPSVKINYLRTVLRAQALRDSDEPTSKNYGMTRIHHITYTLLGYFLLINALTKQKCAMIQIIRKPRSMMFNRFTAQLIEMNNCLLLFPESESSKKMTSE